MSVDAKKTFARNSRAIKKCLVASPRIGKESVPTNQFNRAMKSAIGPIYPSASICRSLPSESPIVQFPDNISDHKTIENCVRIELYRSSSYVRKFSAQQTLDISLDLKLRVLFA